MNLNEKTIGELFDMLNRLYDAEDELKEKIKIFEEYVTHRMNADKRRRNDFVNKYKHYRP